MDEVEALDRLIATNKQAQKTYRDTLEFWNRSKEVRLMRAVSEIDDQKRRQPKISLEAFCLC